MKEEGTLTEFFLENYREKVMGCLSSPEEKEEFYTDFVYELSQASKDKNDFSQNLIDFYSMGIIDPVAVQIATQDDDFMIESFINDKTSPDVMFKLFNDSLISKDLLLTVFSEDEIASAYSEGKISSDALFRYLPAKSLEDTINSLFERNAISFEEVFKVYLSHTNLDVSFLSDLKTKFEEREHLEKSISVYDLIPKDCPHEKIKSLYINYILDHDGLMKLLNDGIISEEEFNEFSNLINKQEFFEKLSRNT